MNPINDVPTVLDDHFTLDEGAALSLSSFGNDSDDQLLDPDALQFGHPAHGTVFRTHQGVWRYQHDGSETVHDSFPYVYCDPHGLCAHATTHITVTPVDDPPQVPSQQPTVDEGGLVVIDVISTVTDVDSPLSTMTLAITAPPSGEGTASIVPHAGSPSGQGVRYVHDGEESSGSDVFGVRVCSDGGACTDAQFPVAVLPLNDPPVANPDSLALSRGTSALVDVLANDTDPDWDVSPSGLELGTAPSHGHIALEAGQIRYTHDDTATTDDSFTYVLTDSAGTSVEGVVTVSITDDNVAPTANDDTSTVDEAGTVTVDVLFNDTDPDDVLTMHDVVLISSAAHGTASLVAGGVQYVHDGSETLHDSVSYEVCDSRDLCDTATVLLTVQPVNDLPTAVDDGAVLDEGDAIVVDVLANDTDAEGTLGNPAPTVLTPPSHGVATVEGTTIRYAHDAGETVQDSFVYEICDPDGGCASANVDLDITPLNDPATVGDLDIDVVEGTTVELPLADDAVDPDSPELWAEVLVHPSHGSVQTLDGVVTYSHDGGDEPTDSLQFTLCDPPPDAVCSSPAIATLHIQPVDDPPVANDDAATLSEGGVTVVDVLANDIDVDTSIGIDDVSVATQPAHGIATVASGGIRYTHDGSEAPSDSFTYSLCDATTCVTATVDLGLTPVSDPPVANDFVLDVDEGGFAGTGLGPHVSDPDTSNAELVVTVTQAPLHGHAGLSEFSTSYTHDGSETTIDAYTIEVCDEAQCDELVVDVVIAPVNDAPTANDDSLRVEQGATGVANVLGNDDDPDSTLLSSGLSILVPPTSGHASVEPGGITYTHDGTDTFSDAVDYRICDLGDPSECSDATLDITVTPIDDPPLAHDDVAAVDRGASVWVDVLANDSDDGPLSSSGLSVTSAPAHGTALVGSGGITYGHGGLDVETDSFGYQICDTASPPQCDLAQVDVGVGPVGGGPVAVDDLEQVGEGATAVFDVLGNDTVQGSAVVSIEVGPSNGMAEMVGPDVRYTHDGSSTTTDALQYRVCEGSLCDLASVSVDIVPENDPPVADPGGPYTVIEGSDPLLDGTASSDDSSVVSWSWDCDDDGEDGTGATLSACGAPDDTVRSVFLTVTDGEHATHTASTTVTVINGDPVVTTSAPPPQQRDATFVYDVDADDPGTDLLSWHLLTGPPGMSVDHDGVLRWTTTPGTHTLEIEVRDDDGGSDRVVWQLEVSDNAAPTALDDTAEVQRGEAVTIDVLANDTDDGPLSMSDVTVIKVATFGHVTLTGAGATYTHDGSFPAEDSFDYQVCDSHGVCSTATVTITVLPDGTSDTSDTGNPGIPLPLDHQFVEDTVEPVFGDVIHPNAPARLRPATLTADLEALVADGQARGCTVIDQWAGTHHRNRAVRVWGATLVGSAISGELPAAGQVGGVDYTATFPGGARVDGFVSDGTEWGGHHARVVGGRHVWYGVQLHCPAP